MRKQSLKQKDMDSFCIKHIKEALTLGTSVCRPNRNFDLIREKVESIVDTKYKNVLTLNITADGIVISKIQADRVKEPARKSNAPANAIFTPLRRPTQQVVAKAPRRESW